MGRGNIEFRTFTKFYRDSKLEEGYHLSMEQAAREAGRIWNQMGDHDKETFRETLDGTRGLNLSADPAPRNDGSVPRRNFCGYQKRYMKDMIRQRLDYVESIESFEKHVFLLAFFRSAQNEYMPCEIAVLRFSIERGIENYFHVVLKPDISGDEYMNFRKRFGDIGHIVRIKDTPNSVQNRQQLREALLEFCGSSPLLVPTSNLGCAKNAAPYFNFADTPPNFEVIDGQYVFFNFAQRIQHFRLTRSRITKQVDQYLQSEHLTHLRCDLHQQLTRFDCALESCLSFAYALSELFPDDLKTDKKPITHLSEPGKRPEGLHYTGNGVSEEDTQPNDSWEN